MIYLLNIFRYIWRAQKKPMIKGIILAVLVLVMGGALLGLSGWFIVATGAAGLATGAVGMAGSGMNVFGPSAGVRGFAIGRTLTRYGERIVTHDATLRALADLRVLLLKSFSVLSYLKLLTLRGGEVLNRLTADIDALDGIALRLVIPFAAGGITLGIGFTFIWALVGFGVAVWITGGLLLGVLVAFRINLQRAKRPARLSEYALQALRVRIIDLLRGQSLLLVAGKLNVTIAHTLQADARKRDAWLQNAQVERLSGFILSMATTIAGGGALYLGAHMVRQGDLSPAFAAFAFFITLGLAEIMPPLQRGMAELGRMIDAARRVSRRIEASDSTPNLPTLAAISNKNTLEIQDVIVFAPGKENQSLIPPVSLLIAPGETIGITGKSGVGKSTLLAMVAGLLPVQRGKILISRHDIQDWPDGQLREHMGVLMQRSMLMRGTIRENLALAKSDASDTEMLHVLKAVAFETIVQDANGLSIRLGESGSGLSGGEQRRLALARVLLREPKLLLLDEPCEGLDDQTAQMVLQGIRKVCPKAAILVATHRPTEISWCDKIYHVSNQ